jgi:hypothetical protein
MNISLNKYFLLLFSIFLSYQYCYSLVQPDKEMSLKSEIYAGFSYNLTYLLNNSNANIFPNPGIRLLWDTDTRLNLGIESAFLSMIKEEKIDISTEFSSTDFSANINTIPIMVVFNMNFDKLDFYAGAGISLTYSVIEAFSDKSISNIMNGSYMFAASYSYKISDGISLGFETGIYYITDIDLFLHKINMKTSFDMTSW